MINDQGEMSRDESRCSRYLDFLNLNIIKMKTRKRYEVMGMMEWHPEFMVGKTRLQISFTGGHLCSGAHTPAVFETADPVVQKIIERSEAFRSRRIRIGAKVEIPDDGANKANGANESNRANDANSADEANRANEANKIMPSESVSKSGFVFEYKDDEEVFQFLEREKGVPVVRLLTREAFKIEAERLGIILKKIED